MRVHSLKTLREFWKKHTDVKDVLKSWFQIVEQAQWSSFSDIKKAFGSADVILGNRVVFNIKGNKYRLIVRVNYDWKIVYIRFVGTHAEYDKVNAESV